MFLLIHYCIVHIFLFFNLGYHLLPWVCAEHPGAGPVHQRPVPRAGGQGDPQIRDQAGELYLLRGRRTILR